MFRDRSFAVFLGHRCAESTMREEQMLKNYWRHRVVGGTTFIFLAPEAPLGTQQPSSQAAAQPSSSSRPSGGSSSSSVPGALRGWQSALRFNLNKKRISHFAAAALQLQSVLALHPPTPIPSRRWWLMVGCLFADWMEYFRLPVSGAASSSSSGLRFGFWLLGFRFQMLALHFRVRELRNCGKSGKLERERGGEGGTVCWKTAMQRKNLTTLQHANAWIDFDLAKFLISCSLNFLRCAKVCQAALSPAHSSLKTDRTADTLSATRS